MLKVLLRFFQYFNWFVILKKRENKEKCFRSMNVKLINEFGTWKTEIDDDKFVVFN